MRRPRLRLLSATSYLLGSEFEQPHAAATTLTYILNCAPAVRHYRVGRPGDSVHVISIDAGSSPFAVARTWIVVAVGDAWTMPMHSPLNARRDGPRSDSWLL